MSTLGWRVDSGLAISDPGRKSAITSNLARILEGAIRPEPDDGDKPERQLVDVTVGADMLLNQNIAAYAAYLRQKIPLTIATICIRWGLVQILTL